MTVRRCTAVVLAAFALLAAGCSGAADGGSDGGPAPSAAVPTGLTESAVVVPEGMAEGAFDTARQVLAPAGWTVSLAALVPDPRLLAWAPDGRLLVSRPKEGDVLALRFGSGAPQQQTLVADLNQPHGLAFDDDTLYVAESDQVNSYRYADGAVADRKVVLAGLPDGKSAELRGAYAHALKSVTVDRQGNVYVSVGSTGNLSEEDRSADPERATILQVPAGGNTATVFARGVRNGTGLAVAPDGSVWTAVNNRDNIAYPYDRSFDADAGDGGGDFGQVLPSYVADHPMEPLAKLTEGRDLGWPYCNPDPDVDPGVPGSALTYADRPFLRDVQTNANGSKLDCAALAPVEQGLGAHSAPLGLSFASDLPGLGDGALVGVHGSWNRQPPRAPEVAFFGWTGSGLTNQQTLLGGFQNAAGQRWGRPVMAAQGPDGAVYVSDDKAGAIYKMTPPAR